MTIPILNEPASSEREKNQRINRLIVNVAAFAAAFTGTSSGTNTGDQTIFGRSGNVTAAAGDYALTQIYNSPITPQGRLTLSTGTPVMTSTVSGASTVYYTPHVGQICPLYDGTRWTATDTGGELSQTLADTTKSPAASVQDAAYDLFVWSDSGTIRCTRGPVWTTSATVTMTIATPAVVTWTGHPLHEGSPIVFTNSGGALPTGVVSGTVYYVAKSPAANTFNICSSVANVVAGTLINTSGSQSGTHTGTNHDTLRGTGAGTSELTRTRGLLTNANAITNGPAATKGLYVGTIRTNPSNTVDFILGGLAASGTAAVLYLWNYYNRIDVNGFTADSTDSWTYATATWRSANASATMRVSFIIGINEDPIDAIYDGMASNAGGAAGRLAVGLDTTTTFSGIVGYNVNTNAVSIIGSYRGLAGLGWHFVSANEHASGATATFYGDAGIPTVAQTGMYVRMKL